MDAGGLIGPCPLADLTTEPSPDIGALAGGEMTSVVKISETYDLSTQRNKIGLIGIHTPPRALLERHFGPLMRNYRFAKLLKCDVTLVPTASLPLDPNGVGTLGNQVAPQDAVNPLLYKAVSNTHFETLLSRIYGGVNLSASSDGSSVTVVDGISDNPSSSGMSDISIYYGLLSQPKGWRKAFWNTGFHMGNLKPLMHEVIANYGNEIIGTSSDMRFRPVISQTDNAPSTNLADASGGSVMRGRAVVCPALPLWGGLSRNALVTTLIEPVPCDFPTVYVGAIVVPPTTSTGGTRFYFRMRITWTVKMIGLVSYQEHSSLLTYSANGQASYWNDYMPLSKSMDSKEDSADVSGLEIEKIMESGV